MARFIKSSYNKVLCAILCALGFGSCARKNMQSTPHPVMYGSPYIEVIPDENNRREEIRVMYGVRPAEYQPVEQAPADQPVDRK